MKLKYLAVSIVFLFTSILNNSDVQDSKIDLLCNGKWYMSSMESGGNKMPVPKADKNSMWMIFSKDGKHEVNAKDKNSKAEKGLWKFSKNKDSIIFTTEQGNIKPMKLKDLTKKELNLVFDAYGREITIYLERKE